jgi:hypothetical protein
MREKRKKTRFERESMAQRIEWNETRVKCIAQEEKPGRNFTFALVRPSWFPSSRESWKAKEEEEGKEKKRGKPRRRLMTLAAAIGWSGDAKTPHSLPLRDALAILPQQTPLDFYFIFKETRKIHPLHILFATSSTAALCMNLRHSRRRMSQAVLGRWIVYFCCWGFGHWPPIPQSPNLHCNEERAHQFCFFFLPSVVAVVCVRIFQVSTHLHYVCWELRKMKVKSNEKCIKWI